LRAAPPPAPTPSERKRGIGNTQQTHSRKTPTYTHTRSQEGGPCVPVVVVMGENQISYCCCCCWNLHTQNKMFIRTIRYLTHEQQALRPMADYLVLANNSLKRGFGLTGLTTTGRCSFPKEPRTAVSTALFRLSTLSQITPNKRTVFFGFFRILQDYNSSIRATVCAIGRCTRFILNFICASRRPSECKNLESVLPLAGPFKYTKGI